MFQIDESLYSIEEKEIEHEEAIMKQFQEYSSKHNAFHVVSKVRQKI